MRSALFLSLTLAAACSSTPGGSTSDATNGSGGPDGSGDPNGSSSSSGGSSGGTNLPPPASGSPTARPAPGSADIFTATYASDVGNWGAILGEGGYSEPHRDQARVAGGGPHGLDAFQVKMIPTAAVEQPYAGHGVTLPNFATGTSRFYRWYEYHDADNDYVPADGGGDFVLKRLSIGAGGGNRMIINIDCNNPGSTTTSLPHIEVIFDTGTVGSSSTFSKGAWHAIQAEVRWNGSNSYVKVWLDNDAYASPTINYSPGSTPTNSSTGVTEFGMYSNDTLLTGHKKTWRDAGFRVASTFDSNWYGWLQ